MSSQSHTYQFQDPNSPEELRSLLIALVLEKLRAAGEAHL